MENKKSLLKLSSVEVVPNLTVRIPTVGEILEDEFHYYNIVSSLTAVPFQYMVQLDDMGIDYTAITEYELFSMLFLGYVQSDLSILFGDLDMTDFKYRTQDNRMVIYSNKNNIVIDEYVYSKLADTIRKINLFDKVNYKPGNEHMKKYLLEKERKKLKRNAKKPKEAYLEKLVIALVNTSDFPYDYETCMDISIYKFNQSFKQIQHRITFDNTMLGIYSGTVDTSKMINKDALSWISIK